MNGTSGPSRSQPIMLVQVCGTILVSFHLPYARQYSKAACRVNQARACVRQVSPDERMVAWGEDRRGNEAYYLRVRDIATGKDLLPQPIKVRALASVTTSCLALSQYMCAGHSRCVTRRLHPAEKPGRKAFWLVVGFREEGEALLAPES